MTLKINDFKNNDKIVKGSCVIVRIKNDAYKGYVKIWDESKNQLGIQNVSNLHDGKVEIDLNFYKSDDFTVELFKENESVDVIQEKNLPKNEFNSIKCIGKKITDQNNQEINKSLTPVSTHFHDTNLSPIINSKSYLSPIINSNKFVEVEKVTDSLLLNDYLSAVNVLKILNGAEIISMQIFAENLIRFGKISLIAIEYKNWVYLFDLISLSENENENENEMNFLRLLSCFFTDQKIIKVLNKSEIVIEMLYHQYKIEFKNVFDLNILCKSICINNFETDELNLEKMVSHLLPNIKEKIISSDSLCNWNERPLSKINRNYAIQQTQYLKDLFKKVNSILIDKKNQSTLNFMKNCYGQRDFSRIQNANEIKENKTINIASDKANKMECMSVNNESVNEGNLSLSFSSSNMSNKTNKLKEFLNTKLSKPNGVNQKHENSSIIQKSSNTKNVIDWNKYKNESMKDKNYYSKDLYRFVPAGYSVQNTT